MAWTEPSKNLQMSSKLERTKIVRILLRERLLEAQILDRGRLDAPVDLWMDARVGRDVLVVPEKTFEVLLKTDERPLVVHLDQKIDVAVDPRRRGFHLRASRYGGQVAAMAGSHRVGKPFFVWLAEPKLTLRR